MLIKIAIEGRKKDPGQPFAWKPGYYKNRTVPIRRVWWLWFAISILGCSEYEYATTSYDWRMS